MNILYEYDNNYYTDNKKESHDISHVTEGSISSQDLKDNYLNTENNIQVDNKEYSLTSDDYKWLNEYDNSMNYDNEFEH